jgi:hypothetical protein
MESELSFQTLVAGPQGNLPLRAGFFSSKKSENKTMSPASEDKIKQMMEAGATAAGKPDSKEMADKAGPVGKAANEPALNAEQGQQKPATRSR